MVTRKPLPSSASASLLSDSARASSDDVTQHDVPDVLRPGRRPNPAAAAAAAPAVVATTTNNTTYNDFEREEESVWGQPAQAPQRTESSQPASLAGSIPAVLQPGAGSGPGSSGAVETNPFKRKLQANMTGDSVPSTGLGELSLNEPGKNPWQPALDSSRDPSPAPPAVRADGAASLGEGVWGSRASSELPSNESSRKPTPGPPKPSRVSQSNLISFDSEDGRDNAGWDEIASPVAAPAKPSRPAPPLPASASVNGTGGEDQHVWDDLDSGNGGKKTGKPAVGEDWNMVDESFVPRPISRQSTWENFSDDEDESKKEKEKVAAPAREASGEASGEALVDTQEKGKGKGADDLIFIEQDEGPSQTSSEPQQKTTMTTTATTTTTITTTTQAAPTRQQPIRSLLDIDDVQAPPQPPRPAEADKTETYQIKNISWNDIHAAQNPRVSPILLQNANGPCPLVALVNALSLTTPADTSTALVDALRSREQVSLALLLDAVFDELMSSRRSDGERALPDVDELYRFLKGLHTGMNVNPRFVPTPEIVTAFKRTSLTHLHPSQRNDTVPGTFEDTREMQLYATFNVPLIHGWIPSREDSVFGAMTRRAASYEDVQNLLFREEELELKMSSNGGVGLTEEDEELYHDILEIKTFLNAYPTQLTPYGLDVLASAMTPGSIAILFRNDHFSTLYRHPQTMQLMSLVTDAGYASHDEVIWETLVDVNGEHAEFYSGDFRLVGGNTHQHDQAQAGAAAAAAATAASGSGSASTAHGESSTRPGDGWTTVQGRRNKHQPSSPVDSVSKHEQEDRDLALALQLQEEEEERHRAQEERRNRESRLSEQFIEQQARQSTPAHGRGTAASNAVGGGRYSSSTPQLVVSPRLSSNNHAGSSASSIASGRVRTSSTSAAGSGSSPSSGQGRYHRRPSHGSTAPQQPPRPQVIRPLIPPPATSSSARPVGRPPVHRPVDPDDDEEAPPSYEQAAKQAPYHPPDPLAAQNMAAGVGGSTGSSMAGSNGYNSYSSSATTTTTRPGVYAQNPLQQPQRYPQAQMNRDRDCTIM